MTEDIDLLLVKGQWDAVLCEFCDLPIALHWQDQAGCYRCANANAHPPMSRSELAALRKDVVA